jgi:ribosome biogenesis GTPase A
MAAGIRALQSFADVIDLIIEVRDARLPRSTTVTIEHPKLRAKPRIVLLNRADLAENARTGEWLTALKRAGASAHATVGTRAASLRVVREDLLGRPRKRGVLRAAVVGAPNTGKSSVINALAREKHSKSENRPGVTRHVQWRRLAPGVELLDTPGTMQPKIADAASAWQLALCGSLPESAFDVEEAVENFHRWLEANKPELASEADLDEFARARGMRASRGELDRRNAARKLVSLFRAGKLFRITFEKAEPQRDEAARAQ